MQFVAIFFLIAFILEILSIVFVGKLIGGLATFGLMILSAIFGTFLMRNMSNISKVMLASGMLKNGFVSFYELFLPIRVPLAGLLFIIPGFLSDVLGLLLLLPFSVGKPVAKSPDEDTQFTRYRSSSHGNDDVIEGDFVVRDANGNAQAKQSQKNQDVIEHRP